MISSSIMYKYLFSDQYGYSLQIPFSLKRTTWLVAIQINRAQDCA